jgi:predicted AAA+ superfamily ATPase
MKTISRFFRPPSQSFFLLGPRGSGKSTWVSQMLPSALLIDLLDPETFRLYSAAPERLRALVTGNPAVTDIVLDEIQRVPELLPVVHLLSESNKELRFILTGSSSRKLKKTGADLLGGRALLKTMHPFMAGELNEAFSLSDALSLGLIPVVRGANLPAQTLQSYAALYINEEVRTEGLVRATGNFSRFLETIAFSHASVLNVSNIARECGVERKVVESYIGILEDLLVAWRLPVFTKRARRAAVTHPKFYLFDAGLFRTLRATGPMDSPHEIEGAALEGLVAGHLRAWIDYGNCGAHLYYWRTTGGTEVDFVLYGGDSFYAVEVKNSNKVRPEDLRALKTFSGDYPECVCLLLYRGQERLKIGNVLCIPCEEFLRGLIPGRMLVEESE